MINDKEIARLRAIAEAATPAPWAACCVNRHDGCAHVMHADGMVAEVAKGKWGDDFPAIRVEPGIGGKAEAYMDQITYGEVSVEQAQANKVFIAEMRNAIFPLLDELARVRALAKMEEMELCDPSGTWYDVAQAALKRVAGLEAEIAAVKNSYRKTYP